MGNPSVSIFKKSTFKKSTFKKGGAKKRTLKNKFEKRPLGLVPPFSKVDKNKNEFFFHHFGKSKQTKRKRNMNKSVNELGGSGVGDVSRYNEQFIDLMEKLSNIMLKKGEAFRARAYQKAQETIMAYPNDITSVEQLNGKPGIGPTILEKLNEYVTTGTLKILEREKNNPVNILGDIYGVGPKKAKELVDKGITTIEQLRERQDDVLNDNQKVGLKYYEDILKRIPRSEVEDYKKLFVKDFEKVVGTDSESHMEIVGSYRRGAESSGDIDVIITSKSSNVFVEFIDELIKENIILHVLSRGPTKCLVVARLPSSNVARRVDFLYTSPEEFPFSILYFTGSKNFNTVMRHEALQKGLTMNEHGLYKMEDKKKSEKVDVVFKDEKDIFDYLGLVYKTPVERVDGRAVIKIGQLQELPNKADSQEKEGENKLEKEKPTKLTKTVKKKDITIKKNTVKAKKGQIQGQGQDQDLQTGSKMTTLELVNKFKKNGISVLNNLSEKELSEMVVLTNELYRNQEPILTDNQFDILEDFIRNKFHDNNVIKQIGAPIPVGKNKATLPYEMWSMDKIKPDTKALDNWKAKYGGPYVLSCKLDGVSGLYTTEGDHPKLYTRGDGKVGQDISHLIPHLNLPSKKKGDKGFVIRGEFIIPKMVFENKYKKDFANARNLVSGIVNQKTIDEKAKDIHFVAYEVIVPTMKPSDQFDYLKNLDIEIVLFDKIDSNKLTNELLSNLLVDWRKNYVYEIDGVIVIDDKMYLRHSGNPEHAFAFKMVLSDQVAESKVVDVIWSPSKDGYLKPRVQIEAIKLGGVTIEYATGFNGSFIKDNNIGVGTLVEIIRSGDVIPYIRKVVVPAEEPKMPSVPYKWNDTHVDIMLEDALSDDTVKEKNITGFFRGIGVEGLSSGNISRIIKAGYDSVPKILNMKVDELKSVEGFQLKTATKIHDGIKQKIAAASLVTLMSSTNIFGRGFSEKKIELIMDAYPNAFNNSISDAEKIKKIAEIKGMAMKTAEAFVAKIDDFLDFLMETDMFYKLIDFENKHNNKHANAASINKELPFYGKTIVMTGFRNKELEEKLKSLGANIGTSVSKNTFLVIAKDKDDETGKVLEAKKLGVNVVSFAEFHL
jgi:NAD-dependent DNA ligase/DNA polymerase/3'-5' exonuclease PolX